MAMRIRLEKLGLLHREIPRQQSLGIVIVALLFERLDRRRNFGICIGWKVNALLAPNGTGICVAKIAIKKLVNWRSQFENCGSKADIPKSPRDVRFTPNSGHSPVEL